MSHTLDLIDEAPKNQDIIGAILKTDNKLGWYSKIMCSISGGSDSDITMDILEKCIEKDRITYVFFDTGLEFEATKRHIAYLEQRYGVNIITAKAVKPIPICCKEYGVPFLSKQVSEMISRLQRHDFKWEDKPFDELIKEYPKCRVALRWWCNDWGEKSKFNISYNTWLKEFMIENPPEFRISNMCCHWAKKLVAKKFKENGNFDLSITGIRKAEGGARSSAYKSCFSSASGGGIDEYRPIFWFKQDTKAEYKDHYGVKYSDCYEIWGLPRTGCSGCPYALDFETELKAVEQYEPKLYKALIKVFGKSYEYTRKYREFQRMHKNERA